MDIFLKIAVWNQFETVSSSHTVRERDMCAYNTFNDRERDHARESYLYSMIIVFNDTVHRISGPAHIQVYVKPCRENTALSRSRHPTASTVVVLDGRGRDAMGWGGFQASPRGGERHAHSSDDSKATRKKNAQ